MDIKYQLCIFREDKNLIKIKELERCKLHIKYNYQRSYITSYNRILSILKIARKEIPLNMNSNILN